MASVFTGIVEEVGEVVDITSGAGEEATGTVAPTRLTIHGPTVTSDARHGDSIAVNGVCLTVVDSAQSRFTAEATAETLRRSTLGALRVGSPVNLERAARMSDRLGGHLVQGHVDGTGRILERVAGTQGEIVRVSLPAGLARYVVEKGSITVDGVSLTIVSVDDGSFTVSLIPTTRAITTLGQKPTGDPVNLEVDVIAKYVERLLPAGTGEAPQSGAAR